MPEFHIVSPYRMAGDQPQAVAKLVEGVRNGLEEQTLKGVTGSGKTFTMANIIEQTQRPTLVLAHNKTLAAQLCTELREFFPDNAVEYFVSYYDYYQPEAYIASTDTYIEKDSAINDEIDRLRHSATSALAERRDVIIVSSVSCIYSLGDPIDYKSMVISLRPGMELGRDTLIRRLIDIQYERNDIAFERNRFRVRGDTVEIWPVYSDEDVVRVEFFGDEVDRISRINPLTGVPLGELGHIAIFPASHYVTPKEKLEEAIKDLEEELEQRVRYYEENGKLIEECNEKLEEGGAALLEVEKKLEKENRELMVLSMEVCYDLMQENGEQIEQIDEWINQMRIELKKNVVRKQQKELYNQELYTYMHDIFGPDVMELFDLKYQPKLKAAEKEENSGGEKK